MKVFSHNSAGGLFPSVESAKSYNADDPDADLYSILDQIENYRRDGVFHIKLCYEELSSKFEFPCNEWTQSSNMLEESDITDFNPIRISFPESGIGGSFGGLGINQQGQRQHTLIDDLPNQGNYWYAIGCKSGNFGKGIPGPHPETVVKVELFLYVRIGCLEPSEVLGNVNLNISTESCNNDHWRAHKGKTGKDAEIIIDMKCPIMLEKFTIMNGFGDFGIKKFTLFGSTKLEGPWIDMFRGELLQGVEMTEEVRF